MDEPRAKATVLMVICIDDGNLSATEVLTKTDEYGVEMVLRFLSTYEDVEIKTDGGAQHCRDRSEGTVSTGQDNDSGTDKRWKTSRDWSSGTCEWNGSNSVACVLPGRAGSHESARHSWHTVVSMDVAALVHSMKQTPYERTRGCRYESSLVPFGEVVMAKIADADKMRAGKLDSAWVEAVWVGRVDKSNKHLLLTTKGCIRSRVVRRIPDGDQAGYHAEVQGLPWDTFKGSAEMLRNATVRQGDPPKPSRGRPMKDGSPAQARTATTTTTEREATRDDPMPGSSDDHLRQPTVDTHVIGQNTEMDAGTATVSDDRPHQGVLRMDQEEGITAGEQGATKVEKQTASPTIVDRRRSSFTETRGDDSVQAPGE